MEKSLIVLTIDDLRDNLISLKALIKETFPTATVYSATSGEEGLILASAKDPDVILLDVLMPEMDGFEVCSRLKKDEVLQDIPVVFVTAMKTDRESRIKAIEAGAEAFLTKPIDDTELAAQIRAMAKIKAANVKKREESEALDSLLKKRNEELENELEIRRLAETALRKSESKFKALFDSASVGIATYNQDMTLLIANHKFTELTGYTIDDIKTVDDWWKHAYPDEAYRNELFIHWQKQVSAYLESKQTMSPFEAKIKCKDGEHRYMDISFVAHENLYIITFVDVTARKQAEADLRRERERLAGILMGTNAGTWTWNVQTGETTFNERWAEIIGYTLAEIQPVSIETWKVFTHPDDLANSLTLLNKHFGGELEYYECEVRMKHRDGRWIWVLDRGRIVSRTVDGKPLMMMGTHQDINNRKKAQSELKTSEEQFRSFFEESPIGIEIYNTDGLLLKVNKACMDIFGVSDIDVIVGFRLFDDPNLSDDNKAKLKNDHTVRYQAPFDFEQVKKYNLYTTTKSGIIDLDVQLTPMGLSGGGILSGYLAQVLDITDRKRSESRQQVQYNIARSVVTTDSVEGLVDVLRNELSKVLDTSHFLIALYNPEKDTLKKLICKGDSEDIPEWPVQKSISGEVVKQGKPLLMNKEQIENFTRDKQIELTDPVPACWLGVPITIRNRVFGVMVFQSFTNTDAYTTSVLSMLEMVAHETGIYIERRKMLDDLILAKEKAEESDKLKTAFIQNISHEIRTPLNCILGFGRFWAESELTPAQREKIFLDVRNSGNRLMNTVTDYVDMAMIVSGTMKLNMTNFLLVASLRNMIDTISLSCKAKNLEFESSFPDEPKNIILLSDIELLRKIIKELADNAIKFTSRGKISIVCEQIEGYLRFVVKDTGKGIAPEKLQMIFDLFTQEDMSTTRGYEGSGLGLSISKGLVDLLGGSIWAESQKDQGSAFYFTLPYIVTTSVTEEAVKRGRHIPVSAKPMVLLAEDDLSNTHYMSVVVKKSGCEFLHAANGEDAVKLCREHPDIAMVLMDIKMPVMNGLDATRLIREFRPDLPVVALTAYAQTGDEQRIMAAGCDEYIAKPVEPDLLIKMIKKYTVQ